MLDDDMLRLIYYTSSDSTSPPHMHVYSYQFDDIFKIILPPTLDSALLQQLLSDPLRKDEVIDCTKHSIPHLIFLIMSDEVEYNCEHLNITYTNKNGALTYYCVIKSITKPAKFVFISLSRTKSITRPRKIYLSNMIFGLI